MFIQKVFATGAAKTTLNDPLAGAGVTDLGQLINMVINIITGIGWGLVFIMVALGFVQYVTSRGDKAAVDAAQKWLTYAVIGGVGLFTVSLLKKLLSTWFTGGTSGADSGILGTF